MTGITDANVANYYCTVTCDANNNFTALDATTVPGLPPQVNHVYTYFDVDALSRVSPAYGRWRNLNPLYT